MTDAIPAAGAAAPRRFSVAFVRDYGIVVAFVALFVDALDRERRLPHVGQHDQPRLPGRSDRDHGLRRGARLHRRRLRPLGRRDRRLLRRSSRPRPSPSGASRCGRRSSSARWPGSGSGIGNGLLVTVARVNAFIATLASSIIIYGLAIAVTGGFLSRSTRSRGRSSGSATALGINYPIFVWLGFALFCGFLLSRTTFGRYVYAAGGNAEAARLSGVRVNVVRTSTFAISGLVGRDRRRDPRLARSSTAQADTATPAYSSTRSRRSCSAGVSILGGEGAIWRAVLGAFFLQMIRNGFNLLNVKPEYQNVFKGAILARGGLARRVGAEDEGVERSLARRSTLRRLHQLGRRRRLARPAPSARPRLRAVRRALLASLRRGGGAEDRRRCSPATTSSRRSASPGGASSATPRCARRSSPAGTRSPTTATCTRRPTSSRPSGSSKSSQRGIELIERFTGSRPTGWRAPYAALSSRSADYLVQEGFLYDSSLMSDSEPFVIQAAGGELIELPIDGGR